MPKIVQLSRPGEVELVDCPPQPLAPGHARVRTWYSGISAGTELTSYRGSSPYLNKTWDSDRRMFTAGVPSFTYPVTTWGYSEVGEVIEVADGVTGVLPGELVYGIWGHRSDAVVPAGAIARTKVSAGVEPVHGVFARVGAIALNAVLAAELHLGEHIAVFGQGVIGLLSGQLASLSGGRVIAVDPLDNRLQLALKLGASTVVPADTAAGVGEVIRDLTGGVGVDSAIELSGNYRALQEAMRCVVADGRVVAAGFYQGDGQGLRLGEEFHHNRVHIVASQIGATPLSLGPRWTQARLVSVFMGQLAAGAVDVTPLISHVIDANDAASAFRLLAETPADALQVVLRFSDAPD